MLLDIRETGSQTQAAEQLALTRLEGMLQAFAQTANEAGQKPAPNNAALPAAVNNPQQPQCRPTFELLEVKMLRMLQADLNERTATTRAASGGGRRQPGRKGKSRARGRGSSNRARAPGRTGPKDDSAR